MRGTTNKVGRRVDIAESRVGSGGTHCVVLPREGARYTLHHLRSRSHTTIGHTPVTRPTRSIRGPRPTPALSHARGTEVPHWAIAAVRRATRRLMDFWMASNLI